MTDIVNEYKLDCYQKIMPLGTKDNLWIVEDSVTGRRFVMRKLPMNLQQVYQRLALIHHGNIVEINDIFMHNGFLYVIEEYLEGELLSDLINSRKFSRNQVLAISRQLFNALHALHENHIVHRDIKPENIIMDVYGNIKLIDFDIARIFVSDKNGDTTVKGSRNYAPPEQFGFAQSDQRTDIYSLGVTLNELAVGKLPEEKICSGKLGIVIRRCIEFDPKRRYQNAAQAIKHLDWLEKRTVIFVVFVIIIFSIVLFLIVFAKAVLFSGKIQEDNEQPPEIKTITRKMNIHTLPQKEELFDSAEYQDRIIYVQDPDQYPALLIVNNQEYKFSIDLKRDWPMTVSAEKENEQLILACKLMNGNIFEFEFNDVFSDTYKQQGYYNNIDFDETSPEYEILLDDLDNDGVRDLLVTLAWRHRVDTPDLADRYYLTEYSTLWVVYTTEDNKLACSEPIYFNGYTPELQTDTLLFDYWNYEWYFFQNGIWETWH